MKNQKLMKSLGYRFMVCLDKPCAFGDILYFISIGKALRAKRMLGGKLKRL
mgnify:CR=1 FL=1